MAPGISLNSRNKLDGLMNLIKAKNKKAVDKISGNVDVGKVVSLSNKI